MFFTILLVLTFISNWWILYCSQGDFEKAVSYHTRSIHLADSVESLNGMMAYFQHSLAQDYFELKKYNDAKKLNDFALIDFKKRWFDVKTISEMELLASQIDSASGNGIGALVHYKEYVIVNRETQGRRNKKSRTEG